MKKVTSKSQTTILQDLIDLDSRTISPYVQLLLDDLACRQSTWHWIRHLLSSSSKNSITLLSTEQLDVAYVYSKHHFKPSSNLEVHLLDASSFEGGFVSFDDQFTSKLLNSKTEDNSKRFLIIDSVQPLIGNGDQKSAQKFCRWLRTITETGNRLFSGVIMVCHADCFGDKYPELAWVRTDWLCWFLKTLVCRLTSVCNSVVDFRTERTGSSPTAHHRSLCTLIKSQANLVHCYVTLRKKHPRTLFKVHRQHEHFQMDNDHQLRIVSFLSQSSSIRLEQQSKASDHSTTPAAPVQPQSTFNLMLTKEEAKAKDELVLPYLRYF